MKLETYGWLALGCVGLAVGCSGAPEDASVGTEQQAVCDGANYNEEYGYYYFDDGTVCDPNATVVDVYPDDDPIDPPPPFDPCQYMSCNPDTDPPDTGGGGDPGPDPNAVVEDEEGPGPKLTPEERKKRECGYFSGTSGSFLSKASASVAAHDQATSKCYDFRRAQGESETDATKHCHWITYVGDPWRRRCTTSWGVYTTCDITIDRCRKDPMGNP